MRHELGDKQRLLHIIEAINDIEKFLIDFEFEGFNQSKLHRSATERQLEIIGEAASQISEELKSKYPEIEWQPIKRFRNVIAHEYFGVSVQILWGVVIKELPVLKNQIYEIIVNLDITQRL
jgi:uncharacterized protein with HEPN domain